MTVCQFFLSASVMVYGTMPFWLTKILVQAGVEAGVLLIAAWVAYRLSIRQREKKAEDDYKALLQSLYAEIEWIEEHAGNLRRHVETAKEQSVSQGEIVTTEAPDRIRTSYIEECRIQLLGNEHAADRIITNVSFFLNFVSRTNASLDFRQARDLKRFYDAKKYADALEEYFGRVDHELEKIINVAPTLKELVQQELKKYDATPLIEDVKKSLEE